MPGRARLAALVGMLLLLAACGAPPAAAPSGTPGTAAPALTGPAWTTYHGDAARTGV
ncbi:MAG: hypothetical protein QOE72_580, partial [Chloroflexota bacterium]|nr:hypothetical protein [Chloroflexota bacterium]